METCRECLCFVYLICRNRVPVHMIWNISKTFLSGYLVGCSYGFLWYFSILLGFYFLYAPCLLVLPLSRPLYRRLTDTLYSSWEAFNVVCILSLFLRHFNKLPAESPSIILRSQDCPHGRQFYLRKCFDRHQSSDKVR